MTAAPDLAETQAAVIIPHYNDLERLERCLSALVAKSDPGALAATEVVVVDNNSTDDVSAIRARFPTVRFTTQMQPGAAAARNRGVEETTAERLFFLDADCVPAPDWLETAFRVADRADLVGGRIDTFDETPPPRSGAEAFEQVFAFNQRDYIENKKFSVTANLLTTRATFLAVGEFIPGVSEDMDWCLRAVDLGKSLVYTDELRVGHPNRQDWPALKKKWQRLTAETYAREVTSPLARLKWAIRAGAVAASAIAHVPKLLLSPKLASTTERLNGLGTLLRLRLWRAQLMLRHAFGLAD